MNKSIEGKVSELLSDESKWTKGAFARDELGTSVDLRDSKAACFCLDGALARAMIDNQYDYVLMGDIYDKFESRILKAINKLYPKRISSSLVSFNDNPKTTFANVKRVLKEAGL